MCQAGRPEQIAEFCSARYGVTFPMTEKVDVQGEGRHDIYAELTQALDEEGRTGNVRWNFEKFLLDGAGSVVTRFSPGVEPDDPRLVEAVERLL